MQSGFPAVTADHRVCEGDSQLQDLLTGSFFSSSPSITSSSVISEGQRDGDEINS